MVVIDVQNGSVSRRNVAKGITEGWHSQIDYALVNFRGRWYRFNKDNAKDFNYVLNTLQ